MNAVRAVFIKQMNDLPKNISISLLYVLYPLMTFVMAQFLGETLTYAVLFSAMFVGSTPMIAICNTVAEDNEYKSLRFLVMAGVKPWQYLSGLAGFVLLMSLLPLAAFVFLAGISGGLLVSFIIVSVLGCVASSILGAAIGIFSSNVQQATAIYTPAMLILAFMPVLASVNDTIASIAEYVFSYQIIIVMFYPEASLVRVIVVILANIAVLMVFFVVAYKKKGLRG